MKAALLFAIIFISASAEAKTCTAMLNGTLEKQDIFLPPPQVIYPRSVIPGPGMWGTPGVAKSMALTPPAPIEIECGKPFLVATFDGFNATGMLPQTIVTLPWVTTGWDGNPRTVESQTLYDFGDSYDYPYPSFKLEDRDFSITVSEPAPAGVSDICDVKKLPLTGDITSHLEMVLNPSLQYYKTPSEWGDHYYWDTSKVKEWPLIKLQVTNPHVTIMCDTAWSYEATFEWPYSFDQMNGLCKGEVRRKMELSGKFFHEGENKIRGIIDVKKPTVTYSGDVTGNYSGSDFSIEVEGMIYNDETGKVKVDLDLFSGGDQITWNYTLNCFGASQTYHLFAAARDYLWIMMKEEIFSTANPGYIQFDADLDEKTYDVDMGGQGTVTIWRKWKKEL